MERSIEKQYEVHYYEIDYKKRALITSIVDYLGDIATYHVEQLGIGMDYLIENQVGWVLYKWDIKIDEYPLYGEKVRIRTCAYSLRKFYAYRQFEIENEKGKVIGHADSIWFLIDLKKRRPIRISEQIYEAFGIDLDETRVLEIENIQAVSKIDSIKTFHVRYSDIDTNMHVNNTKYMAWMIETVPMEVIKNYTLKEIKMTYDKETIYGEEIKVETEFIKKENKIICLHRIIDKENKILTKGKTSWENE